MPRLRVHVATEGLACHMEMEILRTAARTWSSQKIKYDVSFALSDKWLTFSVINEFLDTSRKAFDLSREMEKERRKGNNTSD